MKHLTVAQLLDELGVALPDDTEGDMSLYLPESPDDIEYARMMSADARHMYLNGLTFDDLSDTESRHRAARPAGDAWHVWRTGLVRAARAAIAAPNFVTDIDTVTTTWNERYPRYALRPRKPTPDGITYNSIDCLFPGHTDYDLGATDAMSSVERSQYIADSFSLARYWNGWMGRICTAWWPPEYGVGWPHPARHFVVACMYWHPNTLPIDDLFPLAPDTLFRFDIDPSDGPDPVTAFYMTMTEELLSGFLSASQCGATLDSDLIRSVMTRAFCGATSVEMTMEERSQGDFRYVRLRPGMRTTDWRAIEEEAISFANESQDVADPKAEIRRLAAKGVNNSAIARRLGVTRSYVQKILNIPNP